MEKAKRGIARAWDRGLSAWRTLNEHKFSTIAGTLVFFLIMSLVPLLFWLTLLFGKNALSTEAIRELGLFSWAEELLILLQNNAQEKTAGVSVLFLATTLWSSTGFFYHLRRSGEIIYDYKRKKHGWKVRLSAVGLTFLVLFFFAGAGGIIITLSLLMRKIPKWISQPVIYLAVLGLGFLAAWLLNAYICPYRCKPSEIALGSFLTAVAWLVASVAFAVYMMFGNKEKLYGALSLIIVFLLWLYWMMMCFTAGVVFNRRRLKIKELKHKTL